MSGPKEARDGVAVPGRALQVFEREENEHL
jgi:hypothetical protein